MAKYKIVWSNQAKETLKSIYKYYQERSPQGAINVKNDLLKSPKTIIYANQYQVDDINPKCRRIVVRGFKVLYKESNGTIQIMDIVATAQSPEVLRNV